MWTGSSFFLSWYLRHARGSTLTVQNRLHPAEHFHVNQLIKFDILKGILSEMPNMIESLPESWRVPSNITFLIQIAQLLAFVYLFFRWLLPKHVTHGRFIYVISIVNCVTCFLLAIFWKKTMVLSGENRSFGLYLLGFISALISTITVFCFFRNTANF